MKAPEEHLRRTRDKIEALIDKSHVKNLSKNEMLQIFYNKWRAGLVIEKHVKQFLCLDFLTSGLKLTEIDDKTKTEIINHLNYDIEGKDKTGFYPYKKDNRFSYDQKCDICN